MTPDMITTVYEEWGAIPSDRDHQEVINEFKDITGGFPTREDTYKHISEAVAHLKPKDIPSGRVVKLTLTVEDIEPFHFTGKELMPGHMDV